MGTVRLCLESATKPDPSKGPKGPGRLTPLHYNNRLIPMLAPSLTSFQPRLTSGPVFSSHCRADTSFCIVEQDCQGKEGGMTPREVASAPINFNQRFYRARLKAWSLLCPSETAEPVLRISTALQPHCGSRNQSTFTYLQQS